MVSYSLVNQLLRKKNGALDCFFFVDFVTALMVYFASTVV